MRAHFITDSVLTPEEMKELLGRGPNRAAAARKIMSTPLGEKGAGQKRPAGAKKIVPPTTKNTKK